MGFEKDFEKDESFYCSERNVYAEKFVRKEGDNLVLGYDDLRIKFKYTIEREIFLKERFQKIRKVDFNQ